MVVVGPGSEFFRVENFASAGRISNAQNSQGHFGSGSGSNGRRRRSENLRPRKISVEFPHAPNFETFKEKALDNLDIVERKRRSLNEQVRSKSMSKFSILLSIFGIAFVIRMVQRPFRWVKLF